MSGRRSCVNSLWSGTERVRIGERLKATLAGVQELEFLRCKHLEMVDAAVDVTHTGNATVGQRCEGSVNIDSAASDSDPGSATSRRQQAPSPSDTISPPCQGRPVESGVNQGDGPAHSRTMGVVNSRWSTLSWDASSDLLSPPTLDSSGMIQMDSDSRPSSGFYSVSGSSLSDSCYSVSSEAALGLPAPPHAKPLRQWEQGSVPGDHSDIRWSEIAGRQQSQAVEHSSQEDTDVIGRGLVSGDFEAVGLSFLSDLCSSLSDPQPSTLMSLLNPSSSSSPHLRAQLDPKYCTDLVSRRTKEVYSYPSPLHAVALQSPLFTPQGHETSASASPEGPSPEEAPDPATVTSVQSLASVPSLTQLEQYISRLAHQYRNRASSSTSDLTLASTPGPASNSALRTPGKSHGSTQSLSAFESRSAPSPMPLLGSVTPCKSLLGNSARVSLSSIGKKASRNSINLGNLPSATGEDLNISLHLNLNLNLAPGLNGSLGLVENTKNGSCGALRNDLSTATSATSLSSSSATPGLRARSRISTCPSTLSHRSSLEVAPGTVGTSGIGSQSFCRSLDWSSSAPAGAGAAAGITSGSAPGSQRSSFTHDSSPSPKLSEDMAMVDEIVRLSGLSRAVVVGLMEQGVELDVDCFTEAGNEVRGHARQPGYPHRMTTHADQSHSRAKFHGASVVTDLNPQRPAQLSLSVTHSPQSHAGLTPPLSRSPQSHASITPPLSHASSPIHPYQSAHTPTLLLFSSIHSNYQQTPSHSEPPSSTASSPASRPNTRGHSPPRPLQPSPLGSTPLSVFRRDTPSQCSLPRVGAAASAPAVRPRGGSLRQSPDAYGGGGSVSSGGWRRSEGEGLYRGKHISRELVRASTVSSYAHGENYSYVWGEEEHEGDEPARQREPLATKRTSGKLWRGWGKESDSEREKMDRAEYGYGWRRNNNGSWKRECQRAQATCGSKDKRPTVDSSSNRRGKGSWDKRSSSLRLSRRTLFRSESQGLLAPCTRRQEPMRPTQWVSSLDVARSGLGLDAEDGVRPLGEEVDKRLSSTTSLFNLSLSQSLEGSCHSLSPPLSSPSFSPSPPPRALQRSRSLRDLGKRVFGSMRSLSLKKKTSKK